MHARWLDIEGCPNLRDLGGYETVDGGRTRYRTVYRGNALTGAAADRIVREFGVRSVIDLRTIEERKDAPLSTSARVIHLPTDNPETSQLRNEDMGDLYLWNLDTRAASFAKSLEVLAERDNHACVIQCSGGKDRTGILVALLLDLLGVPDDTIVEEYALTEEALSRVPPEELRAREARTRAAGLSTELLHARPATMRRFLEGFRDAYGDAASYARSAGAAPATIEAARANLVDR